MVKKRKLEKISKGLVLSGFPLVTAGAITGHPEVVEAGVIASGSGLLVATTGALAQDIQKFIREHHKKHYKKKLKKVM